MGHPKTATAEEVWATIRALGEAQKKTEEALRASQQRTEESRQKTEESLRDLHRTQQKTEEGLQELRASLNEASGNFNRKWGQFLENLVKGDLLKLLVARGVRVDRITPRLVAEFPRKRLVAEYDLVATNGQEAVVVEVKSTATVEKIDKFLKKLKAFREYFPEYGKKTIYGGIGYLCEPENDQREAAKYAEERGLFVILSPGGESSVTVLANAPDFKPTPF